MAFEILLDYGKQTPLLYSF